MAEIKFSPEAVTDLQQTKAYIIDELLSEQAANNTINNILKDIRMLGTFPNSGAPLSGGDRHRNGLPLPCMRKLYRLLPRGK